MCPKIHVETGVDISERNTGQSFTQELTFAIKIAVVPDKDGKLNPGSCHFLQFITRQTPDIFSYNMENKIIWETSDSHYMTEPYRPKWRVDCIGTNPFYEGGGAKEFTTEECAIFDQPGYAILAKIDYERIIGCTFVIVDEQVIG